MTPHHNYMNYDEGYRIGEKGDAAIQHAHRPTVRGTNCRPAVCTPEGGPQPSGAHRSGCLAASSTAASQPACAAGLELFTSERRPDRGCRADSPRVLVPATHGRRKPGHHSRSPPLLDRAGFSVLGTHSPPARQSRVLPPCSTEPGSLHRVL
jgi:hypothetical protein